MQDKDRGRLMHYMNENNVDNGDDWLRQQKEIAAKVAALYHAVQPFAEKLDTSMTSEEEE